MKIFDTFLFFNEIELLDLRLNILDEVVDYFVITEANVTFSGKKKPLFYELNKEKFKKFHHKIIHNIILDAPDNFENLFQTNPFRTNFYANFKHKHNGRPAIELNLDMRREIYQRDSIINGLINSAKNNDIILLSDLDEIPNPKSLKKVLVKYKSGEIYNFCQLWFMYYLNVYYDREWFGTRLFNFETLKGRSLDQMRYHLEDRLKQEGPIVENGGWHFSFIGGEKRIKDKLDAYSYQGRKIKFILKMLDKFFPGRINKKLRNNSDLFNTGRKFKTINIDDRFPQYLINNHLKFREFIKNDNC
jgi:beta-1,4-mannosyl-glycoprotein beta-1,4-N-acetylglucosaminyltransferase